MRRRRRQQAGKVALFIGGIIAAFLVGEVFLRLTPFGQTDFYIYDPYLGWTLQPGAHGWQREEGRAWVSINRWGYRGGDWSMHKPPGTFRIAVLGDSVTLAQQVARNKTFCAVIQRRLAACPALQHSSSGFARVEVLNFGCDSYGTAQELLTLQRKVWKFHPDMVVLAIFTGNDIRNNSVVLEGDKCRPFYIYRDGHLILSGPFENSSWFRFGCMARFEARHSQVINEIGRARSAVRVWFRSRRAHPLKSGRALQEPGINDQIYLPPSNRQWRNAWTVTEGEIEKIHRECVRRRVRFLAVTLSNGPQDNPNLRARAAYERWLGVRNLDYPDVRIRRLGVREGFDVLNLAGPMGQFAQAHHAWLHGFSNTALGTGHWNALGHREAGALIASHICAMLASRPKMEVINPVSTTKSPDKG